MNAREKLDEFAEKNSMNTNQLIGWSIAADFAEWYAGQQLLLLFEQMINEENEALGKVGFYNQYKREIHANNKYCLAIVKSLIEQRFGIS